MISFFEELQNALIENRNPYYDTFVPRADATFNAFLQAIAAFESYSASFPNINGLVIEYLNKAKQSQSMYPSVDYDRLCYCITAAAYSVRHWIDEASN